MAVDRSIAAIIRETLGTKNVNRFFPNPEPEPEPVDPPPDPPPPEWVPYNAPKFEELVDTALWWLAEQIPVEIVAACTIPVAGRIALDRGPAARILKVVRVFQDGEYFYEVTPDWSEGTAVAKGAWYVDYKDRVFYAIGIGLTPIPFGQLARFAWLGQLTLTHRSLLKPGPISLIYYGVPTEAQIDGNARIKRAVTDYAVHLALEDMIARILRPKNVRLEGVPDIRHNARDYRYEADARLKSANDALENVHVMAWG